MAGAGGGQTELGAGRGDWRHMFGGNVFGAILSGVVLFGGILFGAILSGAILRGNSGVKIHLLQTLKISGAIMSSANIVCIVCFLAGFVPPAAVAGGNIIWKPFVAALAKKNLNVVAYFAFVLLLIACGKIFPRLIF